MKLAIYHNVIAPYKKVFFKQIALNFPGEVKLFTSSNLRTKKREWGEEEISAENLQIKRLPAINLPGIHWYNPGLFYSLLEEDFDALMTGDYMFLSTIISNLAAKVKGKPTVLYTVETKDPTFVNRKKSMIHRITSDFLQGTIGMKPLLDHVIKKYNLYITPSETSIKNLLSKGVDQEKIKKIFNPVNINKFQPNVEIEDPNLARIPKSNNRLLCYVGRLDKNKGLQYLIKSFKMLDKNCKLLIAGDGPQKNNLIKLSRKLGVDENTHFLGYLNHEKIPQVHSVADAFVLPSLPHKNNVEQFPNALLEAMSSGLPCITFDIEGGIKDIHKDNLTGFKAKSINSRSLAKAINKIFESDTEKLGQNARNRIKEKFSPKKIAKKYVKNILKVIEREG